jgi:hypothetical protein
LSSRVDRRLLWGGLAILAAIAGFVTVFLWPATPPPISIDRTWESGGSTKLSARPQREWADDVPSKPVPPPEYQPRDKNEWQGMLVNMRMRAMCDTSVECGLAAACLDHLCGPCRADRECGPDEVCVLDHCLLARNTRCRSRRECPGEETFCILSGYSPDPRGNATMVAECHGSSGGTPLPADMKLAEGIPAPPPPVDTLDLMRSVRIHAGASDAAVQ